MRVAVYGSGGHGKVVADAVLRAAEHDFVGFLDDDQGARSRTIENRPVLAVTGDLAAVAGELKIGGVALGVGDNEARHRILQQSTDAGLDVISVRHPAATVAPSVNVGTGVVTLAGSVVNPFARLEEGVVVNTSASVDHDCRVRRFAHIWPGARLAGNVHVGEFSYIGMGASVIQNVSIGKRVTVGAGAVVLRDLEDDTTAVGVPAKPISEERSSGRV